MDASDVAKIPRSVSCRGCSDDNRDGEQTTVRLESCNLGELRIVSAVPIRRSRPLTVAQR